MKPNILNAIGQGWCPDCQQWAIVEVTDFSKPDFNGGYPTTWRCLHCKLTYFNIMRRHKFQEETNNVTTKEEI